MLAGDLILANPQGCKPDNTKLGSGGDVTLLSFGSHINPIYFVHIAAT